jgi:ribosome biogenesis GTPase / thiamine phosphate phosphatase
VRRSFEGAPLPVGSTASLEAIGLDDARRAEVTALGDSYTPARITRIDRGFALACTPAGELRVATSPEDDLAVGDFVALGPTGAIALVLDRTGTVARLVGRNKETLQVVAANVDMVLVVRPLDLSPSPQRIQSLLTLAYDSGALPVIVLTKADLVDDPDELIEALTSISPGVEIVVASSVTGAGIDRLRRLVTGRTVVFLGESGGGKSTLVNLLVGSERLAVGETRSDGQGRHTTSHRELVALPGGGAIIDTPGVREVVAATTRDQVEEGFSDVAELASRCRFSDCTHDAEPGCALAAALAAGSLDPSRFSAYEAALRDAAWNERRADKAARSAQRKSWRALERQRRKDSW